MVNKINETKQQNTQKEKLVRRDVSSFYKVKYEDPRNEEEFEKLEKIFDDASNPNYYSKTAENNRLLQKKKTFKLKYNKTSRYIEIFEILCKSHLYTINKNIDYDNVKLLEFYYDKKNKRFYRIDIFDKKYFKTRKLDEKDKISVPYLFSFKFISQDIIYKTEYKLTFPTKTIFVNSKKNYYGNFSSAKITVLKSLKTPFPLEYFSIKSIMARKDFKRDFKNYVSTIETGIHKELYKK